MTRYLSIVLGTDTSFEELVSEIKYVFDIGLLTKDDKGRYIATGDCGKYKVIVIDKLDRTSELLCDEHYTLEFAMNSENDNYEYEDNIRNILYKGKIKWIRGVWNTINENETCKIIYPYDKQYKSKSYNDFIQIKSECFSGFISYL
ncbi:hypothetical protein Xmau_04492 [Xenorhabdus mauleonii]|uniref:Uncharacterized protein n=1 Tax=Xenorhabdus mauleonii TaxID=351675 RepID=A0A1I3YCT6_9GAMM|nr:hypothetical protein [Xenorhabdus mauleonii]PHM35611.1 hypothetical protein Xmau_04492 [Xenorhabdus mauleonii]SFK29678.1 hypothetical protein SAMN05421680_1505 [Xenorhabdus mauleonii]